MKGGQKYPKNNNSTYFVLEWQSNYDHGYNDHEYNEFTAITNEIILIIWSQMVSLLLKLHGYNGPVEFVTTVFDCILKNLTFSFIKFVPVRCNHSFYEKKPSSQKKTESLYSFMIDVTEPAGGKRFRALKWQNFIHAVVIVVVVIVVTVVVVIAVSLQNFLCFFLFWQVFS